MLLLLLLWLLLLSLLFFVDDDWWVLEGERDPLVGRRFFLVFLECEEEDEDVGWRRWC